jgi:hypothetical protein
MRHRWEARVSQPDLLDQGDLMTKNASNIIIRGDGTAIGSGNTIIVDKSRSTHHHGRRPSSDGDGSEVLGAGLLLITALVGASYFFALHADQFYMAALALAGVQTWASISGFALSIWIGEPMRWRNPVTMALTIMATAIVGFGWNSYPDRLVQLARSATTSRTFWCGLNDYGHAVALEHSIAALTSTLALLLLLPHSLMSFSQYLTQESSFAERLALRFSSAKSLIAAAIALTLSFVLLSFADPYIELWSSKFAPLVCQGISL